MKKSVLLVIFNALLDTIFMLFSRELYFFAFLLPILNIVLIAIFFKEYSPLHKSVLSVVLLLVLSIIQLGFMKIMGDNGSYALTVLLTFYLTFLPLFVASIVFFFSRKKKQ